MSQRGAENPKALAVSNRSEDLSYAELDRRANRLANYLGSIGVHRNVVVGLYVDRSPAMAIAALAILKAGAAYIPLDPVHPVDRLTFMLNDSGARVVLSTTRLMQSFPQGAWQVVTLDGDAEKIAAQPETPPDSGVRPDDLAYIIYTSGSTGQPKGVELLHSGLSNLVRWHQRAFQVTPADRASAQSTLGFDAAVWELWSYLSAGASLHLPEDSVRNDVVALRDWIVSRQITITFAATAIAERLLQLEWPATTVLRYLLTGADTLKSYPGSGLPFVLVNNYGPTECTVVSTSGVVPAASSAPQAPSIGRPIDGVEIHILDDQKHPVANGAAGEIYIAGAGLGRGYRNRAGLTSERFVFNPFAAEPSARMYRTGDLGRWLPNGELAFLGRVDEQVKIRGYRVEPSEISVALGQHPSVQTSALLATEDAPGETLLTAYLVLAQGATVTAAGLRDFLRQRLPEYMIPAAFVTIPSLPVTEQGKVNRAALHVLNGNRLSDEAYVEPRTLVEEELVKILAPLLKLDRVGVNDNFFLLGGHSLLGTQVIARVSDTFGVDLTLLKLFDHPTVAEMAAEIENLILAKVAQSARSSRPGEQNAGV
ncbi:MAG TPA: amino acid adenylation domain-containing protein [Candidatus Dormibacteraeota bacterium]|nr:amino acid adenylation domain-containing protein [Candidatus Dormibacteraeota bacterium]